ncbi:hypothetical protein Pmani_032200 [Petrolisthes manimaculis]|uniref:Uncharacterized protein n=1 Tax=Petrolisthes manimaculis TaxID=1843537 RepID=A0AAE1TRV9_9EUCA|nr:hypothetical protein Pmani_032200 [Petrolisthes manimaculis]
MEGNRKTGWHKREKGTIGGGVEEGWRERETRGPLGGRWVGRDEEGPGSGSAIYSLTPAVAPPAPTHDKATMSPRHLLAWWWSGCGGTR